MARRLDKICISEVVDNETKTTPVSNKYMFPNKVTKAEAKNKGLVLGKRVC